MRISRMFKNAPTTNVEALCTDSRKCTPSSMYFAMPGMTFDGHDFIDQAIDNGAIAVVHSKELNHYREGIIYLKVENTTNALNQAAKIFYNRPSDNMLMYGITGTNGKSTIANIISWFENEFRPCGYIGTIAVRYGNVTLAPSLTTPDVLTLQKILWDMSNAGMKACAMEVSSHGLVQHRVDGIDFDCAVFTNFTYDHLDFHGTMENYFNAKCILFEERIKEGGIAIINQDDEKAEELKSRTHGEIKTYGTNPLADYCIRNVNLTDDGTTFSLVYNKENYNIKTNLIGMFNVYNLTAAIAACHEEGIPMADLVRKSEDIPQVAGRMERVREGQPFEVLVDFAHTPDGMEKVFQYARSIKKPGAQIIAVFGSAGKRDVAKRKVFGQLADQYCDFIYLTEDDPRNEDPKMIAAQIKEGIEHTPNVFVNERYEAIRQAIERANPGDVVLLLGKGDEVFMYAETGRVPWKGDDTAARECIHRLYDSSDHA